MGKKHDTELPEAPQDEHVQENGPKNKKERDAERERAEERTEEAPPSEGQQRSQSTSDDRSSGPVVNTTPDDTFLGEGVNEDEHPTGGL